MRADTTISSEDENAHRECDTYLEVVARYPQEYISGGFSGGDRLADRIEAICPRSRKGQCATRAILAFPCAKGRPHLENDIGVGACEGSLVRSTGWSWLQRLTLIGNEQSSILPSGVAAQRFLQRGGDVRGLESIEGHGERSFRAGLTSDRARIG